MNTLNKEEQILLDRIDKETHVWSDQFSNDEVKALQSLVAKDLVKSIKDLNIKFMNESYCFTRSDNRYNLYVKTEGMDSFIDSCINKSECFEEEK